MRKCLRCNEEMIEDYTLKVENFDAIATVALAKGSGVFSKVKGKVKAVVCPSCGEISIFFDKLNKLD